jgi:hypothetical protein
MVKAARRRPFGGFKMRVVIPAARLVQIDGFYQQGTSEP